MSHNHAALNPHPAPQRQQGDGLGMAFGLLGGPVSWFVQLCTGFGLASWPCFAHDERRLIPLQGFDWTWNAAVAICAATVGISLAALGVSWMLLRRARDEGKGGHLHLLEAVSGRTRFLALWGVLLGGTFAVTNAFTAVAFLILPRCAG